MVPPRYFESVRTRAAKRWDQLEADPVLAGPWLQLFEQVKSPRHVVSELLQNADDAGATEASVCIRDGSMVFEHNGEDFTEEHFSSLCRFGYSNKRHLHTIGFRGIGFRSTFGLGNEVRLQTPTLSIVFRATRFTEPVWIAPKCPSNGLTSVRVRILDPRVLAEFRENLREWMASPASLLFFRSIRTLHIESTDLGWVSDGPGPVGDSQWVHLKGQDPKAHLLIRSPEEAIPTECIEEIRRQRLLREADGDFALPPCTVDLVTGFNGGLFVVLPTGLQTKLPFCCNAPFIQNPARIHIRPPAESPTNRWLLGRIGRLAASVLLSWVSREDLDPEQRAKSYMLLPNEPDDDDSHDGRCSAEIKKSLKAVLDHSAFVLDRLAVLRRPAHCVRVPDALVKVWNAEIVETELLHNTGTILSSAIAPQDQDKLVEWEFAREFGVQEARDRFTKCYLPVPAQWCDLLAVWHYLLNGDQYYYVLSYQHPYLNIFPTVGCTVLFSRINLVRISQKPRSVSDEDWLFLSKGTFFLDPRWPRFLHDERERLESCHDAGLSHKLHTADLLMEYGGVHRVSELGTILNTCAARLFSSEKAVPVEECVRLAHIAAALDVEVNQGFRFVSRNTTLHAATNVDSDSLVADIIGHIDAFAPPQWVQKKVLHKGYGEFQARCSREQWIAWVLSGKAASLRSFVCPTVHRRTIYGRAAVAKLLAEREAHGQPEYKYQSDEFAVADWDFDEELWTFWDGESKTDATYWCRLLSCLLAEPEVLAGAFSAANVSHVSRNGYHHSLLPGGLVPAWILRLRALPCLKDQHGTPHRPAGLLRRTPATEALLAVDSFVSNELDTERTRPILRMLGVSETPSGSQRIIDCLRALSRAPTIPAPEVAQWYGRLDQVLPHCATQEIEDARQRFREEALVLTEALGWAVSSAVSVNEDRDVDPKAAVVHPSVRHLSLWQRLGVADRPTAERALAWLGSLAEGKPVPAADVARVRALLSRYPVRVWNECGHWLNLAGEWCKVQDIRYALTMDSLVPWKHLFPAAQQGTGDLRMLSADVLQGEPFAALPRLSAVVEERIQEPIVDSSPRDDVRWMAVVAHGLQRVDLGGDDRTTQLRELAKRLAQTRWIYVGHLEVIPYIDNTPAGQPREADALWHGHSLYVRRATPGRCIEWVAEELNRWFENPGVAKALRCCYERDEGFIRDHMAQQFQLTSDEEMPPPSATATDPAGGQAPSPSVPTTYHVPIEKEGEGLAEAAEPRRDEKPATRPERASIDRPERPERAPTPKLIDRLALAWGFTPAGEGGFEHPDGRRLIHALNSVLPWALQNADGHTQRNLYLADLCLDQETLELDYEVWELLKNHPAGNALIVTDEDGNPVEYLGTLLVDMVARQELTVHLARYRLVRTNSRHNGNGSGECL